MDLEELRAFLAVVDKGSFMSAAIELGVSRSTLHRRVDSLEAQTGVELLARDHQGVTVTAAGRVLVERGRAFMAEAAALLSATRETQHEPAVPLRLAVPPGLPLETASKVMQLGTAVVPDFQVRVDVREEPLATRPAEVDLVLFHGDPPDSEAWDFQKVMNVPLSIMASSDYLKVHGEPRSADELVQHRLGSWTESGFTSSWPLRDGGKVPIRPTVLTNDAAALVQLVRAGHLISLLPDANLTRIGMPDDLESLIRLLPGELGGSMPMYVATPRRASHPAALAAFVAAATGLLARVRWK